MSKVLTEYSTFEILDHTGSVTLSAFNLSITPVSFNPLLSDEVLSNRVRWAFGDGTISEELVPTHQYTRPGVYDVELVVFDKFGQGRLASYSNSIQVIDFIENTFSINTSVESVSAHKLSDTIEVVASSPYYQPLQSIVVTISGSSVPNYFELAPSNYNHLKLYNTLLYKSIFTNTYPGSAEYIETNNIEFDSETSIYTKLDNDVVVTCPKTDVGSILAGTSASRVVYYTDDGVSDNVQLRLSKNASELIEDNKFSNLTSIILNVEVFANTSFTSIEFSSNGLHGNHGGVSSFTIPIINISDVNMPFILSAIDDDRSFIKTASLSAAIVPSPEPDDYSIVIDTEDLNGVTGAMVGTMHTTTTTLLTGVALSATVTGIGSVVSNEFSIFPDLYYDMYKHAEDYDMTQTFKDLRFQEILLDDEVMFNDFIGSIFGDDESDYNSLGKKLMERISNITDNIIDPDTAEITSLTSILSILNDSSHVFDTSLLQYPNNFKRVMNLLSTNTKTLMGYENQFTENYDPKGITTFEEFGTNLGLEIFSNTYTVTAGVDIVAYEKFSETYKTLNTMQPLCAVSANQYPLSSYSGDWGWPLILPTNMDAEDMSKYYKFFTVTDTIDGTVVGGLLDFDNSQNTMPIGATYTELNMADGIIETILTNTLYNSLDMQTEPHGPFWVSGSL